MTLIKPLPNLAAKQVQASALVVSLQDVVMGLVANSLDAGATRLDVEVDFEKGGCRVEDNGSGIALADFADDAGLGKLYHTSKWDRDNIQYGAQGVFLWAICSLALVRLVSLQNVHQSPGYMVFHHGTRIPLQGSASSCEGLRCRDQGTRVEVRDLFGRMPVRVIQRPCGQDGLRRREREWRHLLTSLSGMLLAWGQPVDFSCEGNERSHKVRIRHGSALKPDYVAQGKENHSIGSFHLPVLKSILINCASVDPLHWTSWVTTSARTSQWTLQALISLDPSPSKDTQFISVGIHHIGKLERLSWLYGAVNELFEHSSFGALEVPDHQQTENTDQKSRHPKTNSPMGKQLRSRGKGTERWPMFFLRIDRKHPKQPGSPKSDDQGYSALIPVMRAMFEGFLREHNIRTWRPRLRLSPSTAGVRLSPFDTSHDHGNEMREAATQIVGSRHNFGTSEPLMRAKTNLQHKARRMKVGLNAFSSLEISSTQAQNSELPVETNRDDAEISSATKTWRLIDQIPSEEVLCSEASGLNNECNMSPTSNNSSSGSEFAAESENDTNRHSSYFAEHTPNNKHWKLSSSLSEMRAAIPYTPWATELLTKWSNPVFRSQESSIPQLSLTSDLSDQYSSIKDYTSFTEVSHLIAAPGSTEYKLRKLDLSKGTVISQVDEKFILVKFTLPGPLHSENDGQTNSRQTPVELLVLMDQHAIDERVQVEGLLADLCQPPSPCVEEFRSSLGHTSMVNTEVLDNVIGFELRSPECSLFREYADHFARWGILYDLRHDAAGLCESKDHSIFVLTLPPVVAKRCVAEPRLLLDLLRSEIWALKEGRARPRQQEAVNNIDLASLWVQLQDCPDGLVELVKSRACRSAIMFNDKLSQEECQELVRKVSLCHLPFQCAHGRLSMVPVVNLGALTSSWATEIEATAAGVTRTNWTGCDFDAAWLAWNTSQQTDE